MMETLLSRSNAAAELHKFRFYYYEPSLPAAIIFVCLFALATLLHTYQMWRSKTWFMIPFVIGGIFEIVGYVGRTISALENPGPYDLIPYIIQSVLLLVAPALFAASIYMELGRIVLMIHGEKYLFIRLNWLTKTFVIGDIASFLIQASGSGLLASGNAAKINTGSNIVIGGLFLQVFYFGLFVVAATIFHFRMAKAPTPLALERPWTKHMLGLYIVSLLILTRSIVRCVEYIQGFSGYVISHEAFLYGFDAVPMFFAVVTMNLIHPGEVARHVRSMKAAGGEEYHQMKDTENPVV